MAKASKKKMLVACNETMRPQMPFWSTYNMNLVQRQRALYGGPATHGGYTASDAVLGAVELKGESANV